MNGQTMSNEAYRAHEGISKSTLFLINKSPEHLKYGMENPKGDTAALNFGRAAHKYILEKECFEDEFAVAPYCDKRTKEGKAIYAEFVANSAGKDVISRDDMLQIIEMSKAIDKVPLARQLLTGIVEQSYFWKDAETDEMCKCRPDCISKYQGANVLVDYKTTDSCEDGHFERSVRKYGYKLQAGMYTEGVFLNELEDYGFVFVAQEKTAPYAVRIYVCNPEFILQGRDQFREFIGRYHDCKVNDNWYGYEGKFNIVTELLADDFS